MSDSVLALPYIRHDLTLGLTGLQWVVSGYPLMFSALLLVAGAVATATVPGRPRRYATTRVRTTGGWSDGSA